MKATALFIPAILLLSFGSEACKSEIKLSPAWSASNGLSVPESVLYDPKGGLLYVSNINGKPTEKNGQGFISRLSPDGTIVDTSWAIGLHAPKGMGIKGTTLFVTDIDRIHAIDTASGKIMKSHDVEGARFLNDIAVDEEGGVYVTDMETNRLHLLKNDVLSVWLELKDFKRPNGLYIEGKVLFVGTGQGVLKIDTALKSVVMEVPHAGGIDGLRRYGRGAFIVSDWKGKTELIARGRNAVLLVDTTAGNINAADLEYIPEKRLVIIPTFFDNRVVAYTLGK